MSQTNTPGLTLEDGAIVVAIVDGNLDSPELLQYARQELERTRGDVRLSPLVLEGFAAFGREGAIDVERVTVVGIVTSLDVTPLGEAVEEPIGAGYLGETTP